MNHGPTVEPLERRRVRWLCRRGMKELDVVLGNFFDRHYDQLPASEQAGFVALLECHDPDIWSWILGEEDIADPRLQQIVERIRRA